jgi:hypothetical protein
MNNSVFGGYSSVRGYEECEVNLDGGQGLGLGDSQMLVGATFSY